MMDERMGPIVVGVDRSDESRAAWEYAAEEAAARVTPLIVVHAVTGNGIGDDIVAEAVGTARAQHPALAVTGYAATGDPVRVLSVASAEAGLLVVGHRRREPGGGRTAASVARRLVGAGPVPLLVHRPLDRTGEVTLPRPVLVGIDPAGGADALARFAFTEAALRGTPLRVIWVGATGHAENGASDAVQRWSQKYPDVAVSTTPWCGVDAWGALATASRSAQLAIVGTTGRPVSEWAARALVDRAGCPVAVITL